MKIFKIDIKEGVYSSQDYEFYVNISNWKQNKAFTKTYYIEDKKKRLDEVRGLLKGNNDLKNKGTVTHPKLPNWQDYDFENFDDYMQLKQTSMFYNVWVEVGNKRKLEIEFFIETLYNEMDKLKTNYDKICFLIDQQYKEHKGVFDHEKSDFLYRGQYSSLIYDILQKKINEISNTKFEQLREPIKSTMKKPLVWSAQKNTIGTLFGLLSDKGFIKGHKTDIVRGLTDMFDNLSKHSLTDNVNLKVNKNEAKTNYDPNTSKLLVEWLEYLKNSTPKK